MTLLLMLGLSLYSSSARGGQDDVFAVGVKAFDAGDFVTAQGLFEAAAEYGEVGAVNNLAVIQLVDPVRTVVYDDVVALLKKGVDAGLASARFNFGVLLRRSHGGDPVSASQAEALWRQAAGQGLMPAVVNTSIADLSSQSSTVAERTGALARLVSQAEQGSGLAMYTLGVSDELGLEGEVDVAGAEYLEEKAEVGMQTLDLLGYLTTKMMETD